MSLFERQTRGDLLMTIIDFAPAWHHAMSVHGPVLCLPAY